MKDVTKGTVIVLFNDGQSSQYTLCSLMKYRSIEYILGLREKPYVYNYNQSNSAIVHAIS